MISFRQFGFLFLIAFYSFGCKSNFDDFKIPTDKVNYAGFNISAPERYVVDSYFNPLVHLKHLEDTSVNKIVRPYFNSIVEDNRLQSMFFKKDNLVTVEKYSNGNITGVMDLHYKNSPYDLKIFDTNPTIPLYQAYGGLSNSASISMYMLFTLKDNGKPLSQNIKSSIYISDEDERENFVESAIYDFDLYSGDTVYLQQVFLEYDAD